MNEFTNINAVTLFLCFFWGAGEAGGCWKVCILFIAIFSDQWDPRVIGVLGHLSSNALSGVESVPWFHGAKRLISEWRGGGRGWGKGGSSQENRFTAFYHFYSATALAV